MPSSITICPNCDSNVPAEHINIEALLGKCEVCDDVFHLPQKPVKAETHVTKSDDSPWMDFGSEAPIEPKTLQMERVPSGELYILKHWFKPRLFFLLFFCIVWDSFLVAWYSLALTQVDAPWILFMIPTGHLAVGVGLTYSVLAGFLNQTHLVADCRSIIINHRPIPWIGDKEVEVRGIKSLTVLENMGSYSRRRGYWNFMRSYKIVANRKGKAVNLIGSLNLTEAKFVAFHLATQAKCHVKKFAS